MTEQTDTSWEIAAYSVPNDARLSCPEQIREGWEPFAVSCGKVWVRRRFDPEARNEALLEWQTSLANWKPTKRRNA